MSNRPLHIVLEFNSALKNRYSGFWTYGHGLLGGLVQLADVDRVTLLCSRKILAGAGDFELLHHPKVAIASLWLGQRGLERWWRYLPWPSVRRCAGELDVFHSVHHLMPPAAGRPRVLTVHDLRRDARPDLYPHSNTENFRRAVQQADRIVAVSAATKADLVKYLSYPEDKIDVTHLGFAGRSAPATPPQRLRAREVLSQKAGRPWGPYIVSNSSEDRRKNMPGVLRAFAAAAERLPQDMGLVVTGRLPASQDLAALARELGIAGRVLLTGVLSDEDFRPVLAGAEALAFLSLYEGFGLPMLEAMAAGVPVVAADNSCLPEVVGPAGIIVADGDIAAAADGIIRAATDEPLRQRLISLGLERSRQFTWLETARKTVDCYRRAIGS